MPMRLRTAIATAAVALASACLAGCMEQMYPGPRRPRAEVALVQIDGTQLTRFDGEPTETDRLEVLPGLHALWVALDDRHSPAGPGWRAYSVRSLVVCFAAHAGHAYRARPVYAGRQWRPEIVDETRAELVRSWEIDPHVGHC